MFSIRALVLRFNPLQILCRGKNRNAEQAQTAAVNEAADEKGFSGDALMKTIYQIFVEGTPKPQPRPRMALNGHVYNPHSADEWKESIKIAFKINRFAINQITEPIRLKVIFFLPKPKAMKVKQEFIPHAKKPDLDNLLKAVMDAMTEVGVWQDDSLVHATEASKWYACKEKTGAEITVETY